MTWSTGWWHDPQINGIWIEWSALPRGKLEQPTQNGILRSIPYELTFWRIKHGRVIGDAECCDNGIAWSFSLGRLGGLCKLNWLCVSLLVPKTNFSLLSVELNRSLYFDNKIAVCRGHCWRLCLDHFTPGFPQVFLQLSPIFSNWS